MTWRNWAPAVALTAVLVAGCSSSTRPDATHAPSNGGGVIGAVLYPGEQ